MQNGVSHKLYNLRDTPFYYFFKMMGSIKCEGYF